MYRVLNDMNERQEKILREIVEQYIKTAEPVGSKLLAEKKGFDISSATIRSEMGILEEDGYIAQPHTSAGRIPTHKGLRTYIEKLMNERRLDARIASSLSRVFKTEGFKGLSQLISRELQAAVVVAHNKNYFYYTGLQRLFSNPEFTDTRLVLTLCAGLDHMDDIVRQLFGKYETQPSILLGPDNPFGNDCSIAVAAGKRNSKETIVAIVAPVRTDYSYSIALLRESINYFTYE